MDKGKATEHPYTKPARILNGELCYNDPDLFIWKQTIFTLIPESSITKAPTAELRPNQTDQDSLPPYEELDAILHALIEDELSVPEIVAGGFARETVTRVQRLLYSAEYKRRQAPPGVKITRKSFGRDRRYPLTNAFREH